MLIKTAKFSMAVLRGTLGATAPALALALTLVLASHEARAEDDKPETYPHITFDVDSGTLSNVLPHGKYFFLDVVVPAGSSVDAAWMWESDNCKLPRPDDATGLQLVSKTSANGKATVRALVTPKKFDTGYCIAATGVKPLGSAELTRIRAAFDEVLKHRLATPAARIADLQSVLVSELGNFASRHVISSKKRAACAKQPGPCDAQTTVGQALSQALTDGALLQGSLAALSKYHKATEETKRGLINLHDPKLLTVPPANAFDTIPTDLVSLQDSLKQLLKQASAANLSNNARAVDFDQSPPTLLPAAEDVSTKARDVVLKANQVFAAHCLEDLRQLKSSRDELLAKDATLQAKLNQAASSVDALKHRIRALDQQLAAATAQEKPKLQASIREHKEKLAKQETAKTKLEKERTENEPGLGSAKQRVDAREEFCERVMDLRGYAKVLDRGLQRQQQYARAHRRERQRLDEELASRIGGYIMDSTLDSKTVLPGYTERASFYISADTGALVAIFPGGSDFALYVGVNFYFAAVDKNVPLEVDGGFLKRFSLVGGLTLNKVEDFAKSIDGLVGDRSVVAGAGLRLTDYVRMGGGLLLFEQRDPNPTVSDKSVRVAPFVSLSVDSDVVGIIKSAVGMSSGS